MACATTSMTIGATPSVRLARSAAATPAGGAQAAPLARRAAARRHARQAVAAVRAAASSSAVSTEVDIAAPMEVLRRACRTKDVPPEDVMAAMQQVEAAHRQQSQVQGFPASLSGTWRLVFSSPSPFPVKQWQYIPVLEDAVIDVEEGTIDLVSVVGPLDNAFKGRCSFKQDPSSGAYAMDFGFTASWSKWFGRWETRTEFSKEKRKTYSFFLLTDDLAIANSSSGPKTLMYRVK